ncbi:hypothetical protein AMATHDRAFT_49671 [Amanita thiersii Skay4041]|uniref:Uncharacterized protein n=1 Tax=Amanita thiersii Skay4041 TaxID=703135 RepID=A0A2A9NKN0_9AGAR|nr:hypothetical protein AMATHDRAFT_49671 [Amanita thiersii Skay4041]
MPITIRIPMPIPLPPRTMVPLVKSTPTLTGLKVRFPSATWRAAKCIKFCQDSSCVGRLPEEGYDRSLCLPCRAQQRRRKWDRMCTERGTGLDTAGNYYQEEAQKETEMFEDGAVPAQDARLCRVRWCSHIIPPVEEYKWDMCLQCRRYLRLRTPVGLLPVVCPERTQGKDETGSGKDSEDRDVSSRAKRDSGTKTQRCASFDCGMLVLMNNLSGRDGRKQEGTRDDVREESSSLCAQCVQRKAREMDRLRRAEELLSGFDECTDELSERRRRVLLGKRKKPEISGCMAGTNDNAAHSSKDLTYTEYRSLTDLLLKFKSELLAFLHIQGNQPRPRPIPLPIPSNRRTTTAIPPPAPISSTNSPSPADIPIGNTLKSSKQPEQSKQLEKSPLTKPRTHTNAPQIHQSRPFHPTHSTFFFSGQFSTVTTTLDITSRRTDVVNYMNGIRIELERVSRFSLKPCNPEKPVVAFGNGFALRFLCLHSLPPEMFAKMGMGPTKVGGPCALANGTASSSASAKENANGSPRPPPEATKKDVKGELDLIAVADDSYGVLPGQKMVIRFRLGVVDIL